MVLSFNGLPPTKQDIDYSKLSIDSDTMAKEYIDKIDGRISEYIRYNSPPTPRC